MTMINVGTNLSVAYSNMISLPENEIDDQLFRNYGFICKCDWCKSRRYLIDNNYNLYDSTRSFNCNKCRREDYSLGRVYILHKKEHRYQKTFPRSPNIHLPIDQNEYLILKCTSCKYEFKEKEEINYFLDEEKRIVKEFFVENEAKRNRINPNGCVVYSDLSKFYFSTEGKYDNF